MGDVFGCFDRFGAYIVAYLLFLGIFLVFAVIVGLPLVLLVINNTGARAFGVLSVRPRPVRGDRRRRVPADGLGLLDDPHGRPAAHRDRGAQGESRDRHQERLLDDTPGHHHRRRDRGRLSTARSVPSPSASAASSCSSSALAVRGLHGDVLPGHRRGRPSAVGLPGTVVGLAGRRPCLAPVAGYPACRLSAASVRAAPASAAPPTDRRRPATARRPATHHRHRTVSRLPRRRPG